jgi:hypothetical protein
MYIYITHMQEKRKKRHSIYVYKHLFFTLPPPSAVLSPLPLLSLAAPVGSATTDAGTADAADFGTGVFAV